MERFTDIENVREIFKYLKNNIPVYYYDTINSTNARAKLFCESHKDTNINALFVANHQSEGRGRLGRSFYSPSDTGLYMSLLTKPPKDTSDMVCLTTAAAVCVTQALEELCDIKPQIKWVNDIYLGSKKVCGILCEAVTSDKTNAIDYVIIGIGVNISTTDFPTEISGIATSIGQDINRNELCAKITDNLIDMKNTIANRSFIDEYKAHSLVLGKEITYTQNGETKSATAIDIDNNGGLVIKTESGIDTLSTGEISVRVK